MNVDFLIVGAGFSGLTCARILADSGYRVHILDKRSHIGGNAYDCFDEHGVLIHPYGPHIFHTNSKKIIEFLSRFTTWRFYEHRVLASVLGELYPIPVNRTTINRVFKKNLSEDQIEDFLATLRLTKDVIRTSEDVVLSSVGEKLCEMFFRGYTKKQWDLDLSELSAGVAARIPTRTSDDDRYFSDAYQFMPANGYTAMFQQMVASEKITIELSVDFFKEQNKCQYSKLIYTGPIDSFYNYQFGRLPYRSLDFEHEHYKNIENYQAVGTINYPNDYAYTRITEFKHLTGQVCKGTSIVREYPRAEGDPYYPIPNPANEALYKKYEALAEQEVGIHFVGRLAQYRYYNMDQVVGAAMTLANRIIHS